MLECLVPSEKPGKYDLELGALVETYLGVSSHRSESLFRRFLPDGYRMTTIDSVDPAVFDTAILAKVHLGMLITLYDDLADHPRHRNAQLLSELYGLNIGRDKRTPA